MTKETKEKCNCAICKHSNNCPHKDSFRRLPKEVGGLGLCKNLKK